MEQFSLDFDLTSLSRIAFDISECSNHAPEDLKALLQKFGHLGDRLVFLNKVIISSEWGSYDKSPDLAVLLQEAHAYFLNQDGLPLKPTTGLSAKEKLASKSFDENVIQRIETSVDEHIVRIDQFQVETIYLASIRNLQECRTDLQKRLIPVKERLSLRETVRVISEATTALQFAFKLRKTLTPSLPPNLDPMIISSPELIALPSSADRELIEDYMDQSQQLIEKLHLFSRETKPTDNIPDLAQFVASANKLTNELLPSKAGISAEVRSLQLPTIAPSPNSLSSSFLNNYEFQRWASTSSEVSSLDLSFRDEFSQRSGEAARSSTRSMSTQTTSDGVFSMRSIPLSEGAIEVGGPAKQHIELAGWVKIYAGKQTDSQRISCRLDITQSEGSTCIWAVATNRRRKSSAIEAPVAMTPGMLMRGEAMNIASESDGPFRTFQHSFTNVSRPVPHVLHPSVEGPKVGENYSILFHDPQYLVEEGCAPKFTKELKYVFANEVDRNRLRAKIFGKTLLRCVGTEKITFNYIACLQQAITLWEDETTRIKTITFYRDPPTDKSHSPRDVEYKILGITDLRKAEKDGEPLPLNVEQINQHHQGLSAYANRRADGSAGIKPVRYRTRDDMSCLVYFSEVADKRAFVNLLRQIVMS